MGNDERSKRGHRGSARLRDSTGNARLLAHRRLQSHYNALSVGAARQRVAPIHRADFEKGGAMPSEDLSRYVSVVELRVDSHYTDRVVSLGTIVEMFGIAGTKLAYMIDGDGGLMRAFE